VDYASYQRKNQTGTVLGTYGGDERCIQSFGGKPEERGYLEDLGGNGKRLKLIFNGRNRGMGWIGLAQNTDRWRALVSTIMNFWVP
jgi:hypothetical protein